MRTKDHRGAIHMNTSALNLSDRDFRWLTRSYSWIRYLACRRHSSDNFDHVQFWRERYRTALNCVRKVTKLTVLTFSRKDIIRNLSRQTDIAVRETPNYTARNNNRKINSECKRVIMIHVLSRKALNRSTRQRNYIDRYCWSSFTATWYNPIGSFTSGIANNCSGRYTSVLASGRIDWLGFLLNEKREI